VLVSLGDLTVMTFLEKLSQYWQLKWAFAGLVAFLVVYAILLPDPGNNSSDNPIDAVSLARSMPR
jgi:hypothetical protein